MNLSFWSKYSFILFIFNIVLMMRGILYFYVFILVRLCIRHAALSKTSIPERAECIFVWEMAPAKICYATCHTHMYSLYQHAVFCPNENHIWHLSKSRPRGMYIVRQFSVLLWALLKMILSPQWGICKGLMLCSITYLFQVNVSSSTLSEFEIPTCMSKFYLICAYLCT